MDERLILKVLLREYNSICRVHRVPLHPVNIVLFDSDSIWGQFDHLTRTISLARKLICEHDWYFVLNILRHEMAHQWVYEHTPEIYHTEGPHGPTFQHACRRFGLPAHFAKATLNAQTSPLDWRRQAQDESLTKILEKTKKLLNLANSTNEFEAQLAMERVREIYARYNLEDGHTADCDAIQHLVINTGKKRLSAWEQRTLSLLLEHFYVKAITYAQFNVATGTELQVIELIGTAANLLMAEHVYHFLLEQVEHLLRKTQCNNKALRGRQKRSYRLGVLEGFDRKLHENAKQAGVAWGAAPTTSSAGQTASALVVRALQKFNNDRELDHYMRQIHPNMRTRSGGQTRVDANAYHAGHRDGQNIHLHKPMANPSATNKGGLLITRE